ncbi:MAG TPA: uracil-DNA glycosylase [Candidatus Dormibacteraeota bacterium]|nr:uracil-DNA glycosylase [Candidatus Dormibacteraeota bacterium]
MPAPLPEALEKKLAARLRYYEDLGIHQFYKYHVVAASVADAIAEAPAVVQLSPAAPKIFHEEPPLPKQTPRPQPVGPGFGLASSTAPSAPVLPPRAAGPSLFDAVNKIAGDTLLKVREDLGDCTRCKLHKTRKNIVFADGNPKAELVFVGEGPGADEDAQGLPFVGRAGKLLNQMIEAMGLRRQDVYICNVVKCRPPENRLPERDEIEKCSPFLLRQLDTIAPKVIVCLGACAAQTLLETNRGISQFRGQWLDFRGHKLMATYHPAYLLRNPSAKAEVWKDLQKVMAVLGLELKKGKSA